MLMETTKHIVVGTAGHIDHGKSSLVEALTRHASGPPGRREAARITIDLGFAFLELPDAKIGFVDVPGHEKFVRNMLAGAGGIDLVVLVVARMNRSSHKRANILTFAACWEFSGESSRSQNPTSRNPTRSAW